MSLGLPSVSVPVLSTTSVVIFSKPFERLGVFHQHAFLRAASDADHDGHRRGQAKGARAGDDEDRDGVDDGVRELRLRP